MREEVNLHIEETGESTHRNPAAYNLITRIKPIPTGFRLTWVIEVPLHDRMVSRIELELHNGTNRSEDGIRCKSEVVLPNGDSLDTAGLCGTDGNDGKEGEKAKERKDRLVRHNECQQIGCTIAMTEG
ncbi:MAG: hypothetical protein Q9157_001366 [Trypethelium eluteriae]